MDNQKKVVCWGVWQRLSLPGLLMVSLIALLWAFPSRFVLYYLADQGWLTITLGINIQWYGVWWLLFFWLLCLSPELKERI